MHGIYYIQFDVEYHTFPSKHEKTKICRFENPLTCAEYRIYWFLQYICKIYFITKNFSHLKSFQVLISLKCLHIRATTLLLFTTSRHGDIEFDGHIPTETMPNVPTILDRQIIWDCERNPIKSEIKRKLKIKINPLGDIFILGSLFCM